MYDRGLDKKCQGITRLWLALNIAVTGLDLTEDQFKVFCERTPDGVELWEQFRRRRDSPETMKGYAFRNFITEVLADAGDSHIVSSGEGSAWD